MNKVINLTREIGYGLYENCFSENEISLIKKNIDHYISKRDYGVVYEDNGSTIRGVHGLHKKEVFFNSLVKDARILNLAEEYLGTKCYLHQFKVNYKRAFKGEPWPWHQDFPFWNEGDGILNSRLINIAVLLDDASMLNGPLCFIPKSHLLGNLSVKVNNKKTWENDISRTLTYQVEKHDVEKLTISNDVEFLTGKSGDVFLFDPLVVHSSGTNSSAYDRRLLILTYNSVDNLPVKPKHSRPSFLTSDDYTPLTAINLPLDK